jgi:hypothetical protein
LLVAQFAAATMAKADSPDPVLPLSGSAVINTDGTKTLTVEGDWVWTTHHSNCNLNRFAVGWAMDWNDSNQAGNVVGTANTVTVDVGAASDNGVNPIDNAVHYSSTLPRCGIYDAGLGYNSGHWGPLSHTYSADTTEFNVCVVTYDMHLAKGALKVNDDIAGGTNHNHDNSVQSNASTPLGNGCFLFKVPTLTTDASASVAVGGNISDIATLSGGSEDISGTLTFNLYPPSDPSCLGTPVSTTTASVDGNGAYPSDDVAATVAGTYHWVASYGGDDKNAAVTGTCGDEGEDVVVTPPPPETGQITVVKDADPNSPQDFHFTFESNAQQAEAVHSASASQGFDLDDDANGTLSNTADFSALAGGSYTVTEDPTDGWTLASIVCDDETGSTEVDVENGTATIDLAPGEHVTCTFTNDKNPDPGIHIEKTGPSLAHVGDTIVYGLAVTSTTDFPLDAVTVTDPNCKAAPVLVAKIGGNTDALLETGEEWDYTCEHVVTADDADPLPNTATASSNGATDTDDHLVDIIHPAITIDKTPSVESGHPGDPVTYTYKVTNTGDVTLTNVVVNDDKLGHIGDIGTLEAGATATLTKAATIGDDTVTNVGTVTGVDPLEKVVSDTDDATVQSVLALVIQKGAVATTGTDIWKAAFAGFGLTLVGFLLLGLATLPGRRRRTVQVQ